METPDRINYTLNTNQKYLNGSGLSDDVKNEQK